MKQSIREFSSIVKQFGFSYKKRKLEDGLWLNYAEKSMGTWSKIIKFFDSSNKHSLAAGLEVPIIDQIMDFLFPQVFPRNNMEYRIFQTTADPTNDFCMESWLQEKVNVCNSELERIAKPGDLAPFFVNLESRKKTPNADWRDVCKPWIVITYLGRGKAATITAIHEEIKFAEKFEISTAVDYAFQKLLLHRKPRNLYKLAEDLNTALMNLDKIGNLIEYSIEDFIHPEIYPER